MFDDSFEANPECDIFGEPHVGYEEAHKNLLDAYTLLSTGEDRSKVVAYALCLLNSGVYWTSELLLKNFPSQQTENTIRVNAFLLSIRTLQKIEGKTV